jgi:hypothetical protein
MTLNMGFANGILFANNVDFNNDPEIGIHATMIANGQLLIANVAFPNIRVGTLTSPNNTIVIGYSAPNITLDVSGGAVAVEHLTGTTGGLLNPTANNFTLLGGTVAAGTVPVAVAGSGSTLRTNVQISQAIAATDATKIGLAAFNSANFTVDANGFVSLSAAPLAAILSITGNSGGAEVPNPANGNFNIVGTGSITTVGSANTETVQLTGLTLNSVLYGLGTATIGLVAPGTTGQVLTATTGSAPTWAAPAATTDLHTARYIVSAGGAADGANYTTIATAYAAAVAAGAPQTVFIQPGTYTENLTLTAGINIAAYNCDAFTPNVTIIGKITMTVAGTSTISGIRLTTNSDFFLAVTGSAASIVNLFDCYLNASNNTGISLTSSSAGSTISIFDCKGDVGTTGITFFAHSGTGLLVMNYGSVTNSGNSTTASTVSGGGQLGMSYIQVFALPITTSSSSIFTALYCQYTQILTLGSTNTHQFEFCRFGTGTSSAISISAGAGCNLYKCIVISTNTNPITGAGSVTFGDISFPGVSTINTTTQVGLTTDLGRYKSTLQPCFQAAFSAGSANVTGDGTAYQVAWDTAVFDQASNFTTGAGAKFTAPVTGKYLLTVHLSLSGLVATETVLIQIITTSKTYNVFDLTAGTGTEIYSGTVIANMSATDTANITVIVSGGAKTVSVQNNLSNSGFYGTLLC